MTSGILPYEIEVYSNIEADAILTTITPSTPQTAPHLHL